MIAIVKLTLDNHDGKKEAVKFQQEKLKITVSLIKLFMILRKTMYAKVNTRPIYTLRRLDYTIVKFLP